jgi:hypothetical protein
VRSAEDRHQSTSPAAPQRLVYLPEVVGQRPPGQDRTVLVTKVRWGVGEHGTFEVRGSPASLISTSARSSP